MSGTRLTMHVDPSNGDRRGAARPWFGFVLALVVVACLPPFAAAAQQPDSVVEPAEAELPVVEETVVVTARRAEQPVDEVPAHVTVLEQELEHSAGLTVDDQLRQVPGFSLFRRASSLVAQPTTQGVSLRGINTSGASRTLVLLDGVPLNDPFGGWVYWSRVSRLDLERVEIVRGGMSDVWGSSALGGVIQLLSRDRPDTTVDLLLEGGERGTLSAEGTAGLDLGTGRLALSGDGFETAGYRVIRPDQRGAIDVPAWSEHAAFALRGSLQAGTRSELGGRVETFGEDRGNGTPLTGNETDLDALWLFGQRQASSGSWSLRLWGQDQEFSSTFSSQAADRSTESPALDQFLVDSSTLGASGAWLRAFEAGDREHRLGAGLDWSVLDGTTNEDFFWNGESFNRRRQAGGDQQSFGLWVQDGIEWGRVELQLGGRVDRWESEDGFLVEQEIADGSVLRRQDYADRSETTFSPRLGAVWQLGTGQRLTASAYRAFRAPTVNELFRPFRVRNDITAANADLEPEILTGAEIGWYGGDRRWSGEVNLFWNRLDDSIANLTLASGPGVIPPCGFVPPGGTCAQRRNLERTRIVGVESELRARLAQRWQLVGSWIWSDGEITRASDAPELEGKQLIQSPEHRGVLRVEHRGWIDATVQGRYGSDQFEDDLNLRELDAYTVVDVHVAKRLTPRLGLYLAVENLLDEEVEVGETGDGLVTVGGPRLVYGGLRLGLGDGG